MKLFGFNVPGLGGGGSGERKGKGKKPDNPASKPKPESQKKLDSEVQKVKTGIVAHALITDLIDDKSKKRIILAEQDISLDKDWFFNKAVSKSYFIDAEAVWLFGAKKHIVVYDVDYFEPLSSSDATLAGLEPHWSSRADQILRLGFVKQTVGQGAAQKVESNWMDWVIKIGLGIAVGYLIGGAYPLGTLHSVIPTSTSP